MKEPGGGGEGGGVREGNNLVSLLYLISEGAVPDLYKGSVGKEGNTLVSLMYLISM